MRRHLCIIITIIIIIIGIIVLRTCFPTIECKVEVPADVYEDIESHTSHMFSGSLPLIPVHVTVYDYRDGNYYYTISYFPFGNIDEAYGEDGFSPESELY